jgi:hypothetical protein
MPKLRVVSAPFATPDDVVALAEAKLASSGLTLKEAEDLGISWLTAEETKAEDESLWYLPALKIRYFDPWTGAAQKPRPNWPEFNRYRALRDPVPLPDDFAKYRQPPDTSVCAYFPKRSDWSEILTNYKIPLIVTEGEIKAAAGSKHGFPTIGLGGVDSWRAMKQGFSFLPELAKITWPRRETFIIFDSDARSNQHVLGALMRLAEELQDRGALPRTALLPELAKDRKTGLDDYLVAHGSEALKDLLRRSDHLLIAKNLWEANKTYVYVHTPGVVVEQPTAELIKPDALRSHTTAAATHEMRLMPNGAITHVKRKIGDAWLDWPLRSEVKRIEYLPGAAPRAIVEHNEERLYNVWPGWACQPAKGDVKPWLKLVDHLCKGLELDAKKWLVQWFAYPLQNPGAKLLMSVVAFGRGQGTGKTLLGETMRYIYGENFASISQEAFSGSFNAWASGKQFVCGDDVTSTDKKRDLDKMKMAITQTSITINEKFKPPYTIRDTIAYYWSSNHCDVLALEEMDRRFFVLEVTASPLPREFYQTYDVWMKGAGAAALFDYLLHVDMAGFDPGAQAPDTAAKRGMIQLARTDVDKWIIDMLSAPDEFLKVGDAPIKGDLLTLAEIRAAYETVNQGQAQLSQVGLNRKLAQHGVKMINGGENVYIPHRKLAAYYIVRRREHWTKQSLDAQKRHIGQIAAENHMRS